MPQPLKISQRRVQGYLKQSNFNAFRKIVEAEDISQSKCLNMIINEWFNSLSPGRKQDYKLTGTGVQQQPVRA